MATLQKIFPPLRDEHGMKMYCACGCGRLARHIHHVIPRSQGGTDDPQNLVALCQKCHVAHHSKQGDFAQWGKRGGAVTAQKAVSIPNLKQFQGEAGLARWQAYQERKANAQMGVQ